MVEKSVFTEYGTKALLRPTETGWLGWTILPTINYQVVGCYRYYRRLWNFGTLYFATDRFYVGLGGQDFGYYWGFLTVYPLVLSFFFLLHTWTWMNRLASYF